MKVQYSSKSKVVTALCAKCKVLSRVNKTGLCACCAYEVNAAKAGR